MPKVMVVDDNEAIRTLLRKTLERAGHEVVTAESGAEALQLFKTTSVDVVATGATAPPSRAP